MKIAPWNAPASRRSGGSGEERADFNQSLSRADDTRQATTDERLGKIWLAKVWLFVSRN
jgi:hypothetical protein